MPPKNASTNPRRNGPTQTGGGPVRARNSRGRGRGGRRPMPPTAAAAAAMPEVDGGDGQVCFVCTERAKDWAVGSCPHVVCGDCSHRMRVLYDDRKCAICKMDLRQVAVVPVGDFRTGMTFEEAVALPGAFQDKQVNMWFVQRERCQQLKNVRGWVCGHKSCARSHSVFVNAGQLRGHVKGEHRSVFCEVCLAAKRNFVGELQLFALEADRNFSGGLRAHLRKKHPLCKFCRRYFYDDDKLFEHLQERHESCTICERNGRLFEYYENYAELERHYKKEHYVCQNEDCRGMVFSTQIELQTHEHTEHSGGRGRGRAFRVDLQQLHGERDARRDFGAPLDVRVERERQAVRRRNFLSSSVVFTGALNSDDAPPPSAAEAVDSGSRSAPSTASAAPSTTSSSTTLPSASNPSADVPRPPDDGHFHPLALPRDSEEMHARNTVLVKTMRSQLDAAAYEHFRKASGEFHRGTISADEYYDAVTEAFGVRAAIRDVLPELVALLPTPLLREPLLQTCFRRTDTKGPGSGYLGPSVNAGVAGSSSQSSAQTATEQFPSLNGKATPIRQAPLSVRRFGAPGPEEFPRLNKVNKAQRNTSNEAEVSSISNARNNRQVMTAAKGASSSTSNNPSAKTAASVLRETPRSQAPQQQRARNTFQPRAGPGPSVQLTANAFPALAPGGPSSASNLPAEAPVSVQAENNQIAEALAADVSMRVGAVWGGASGRAQNDRSAKKRGPGRGRIPASPPKGAVLGGGSFPDLRAGQQSESDSSASENQGASASGRQSAVVDVMAVAQNRRNALQKSSLPRVGGSGYGFAWERKKLQKKKKQIKSAVQETNKSSSRTNTSFVQPPLTQHNNSRTNSAVAGSFEVDKNVDLSTTLDEMNITEDSSKSQTLQQTADAEDNSAPFDPYSYLRDESVKDDATASFLGKS